MRSREEFGKYLLLKKLSEDPLGETFRAGLVAGGAVEQVVLLRVFNGRNVDAGRLAASLADREAVQGALKNPNIGTGVDLGEERGVPFVAYEYISGRNLENLLIQASNTNSPIPMDHALLIAERMSLALAAAAETWVGDQRVLHGFAVPHLVMVSNEGETRVLGFEAAAGLVQQAGGFERQLTRYVAPEVVGGQEPDRSDDVFTLGTVLFELLACQPLPEPAADGYGSVVDNTRVAYDGSAFPESIAALLKESLAPRAQRVADAGTWHKSLTQLMADAGHAATTFNLAFFMHNLFRREIEEEHQEIEEEKRMAVEAPPAAAAPQAEEPEAAGAEEEEATVPPPAAEEERKGNKGLLVALAAVVLIALVGGGWYLFGRGGGGAESEVAEAAPPEPQLPAVEEEPADAEPAEPQGPSPEEIQAQLSDMIDARSEEMEEKLRTQYDQRIRDLQSQLQSAQAAAEQAAEERRRQQEQAAEEARLQQERERAAAEAAEPAAGETADTAPGASQAAGGESAEPGGGEPATAGGDGSATTAVEPGGAAEEPVSPARPEPEPPEPDVQVGDLVSPGIGVKPPELIEQPSARYPPMARKLGKEADVEVRVLVDETGRVRNAELVADKKAGFGFDPAALDAARSARFRPATKDGVRVKMYYNLTIRFQL